MSDNTTGVHSVSTSLPDDLWERFEAERHEQDRNISQHLRRIVREHYARQDAAQRHTTVPVDNRPYADPDGHSVGYVPGDAPRSITVGRTGDPHQPYIGRDLADRLRD